ncbi:site-specific DNA-methyltransferase [Oscillospiraceae bacterium OttesenSCG-928-F05]|nr:site-specific DNA-methyltransferase [Oscillospiraceae bacterium OttesenSCG-928-F05]
MQRLELNWIGKYDEENKVRPEPRILIERPEFSYQRTVDKGQLTVDSGQGTVDKDGQLGLFEEKLSAVHCPLSTENMLIHGDNLLALKALELEYAGKVKCICIDPPYNTGSAFEHYDDNLEHSKWLNLMKPRLELLKKLLADDGSIWINIDDDEMAYLKVMCDEVFGRRNYITSCIWQKRTSPDMRVALSDAHEYIVVYAKNKEKFMPVINKLPLDKKQIDSYKNPDNDPRGPWASSDYTAQGYRPNQMYKIITPGGAEHTPPEGKCWKNIESVYLEQAYAGMFWFGKDGLGIPRRKTFLYERTGINAWTWWANNEVGHSQEAKKESVTLFGAADTFATPKPERLIQRILHLATNPGDLVLDSFLGSGTTAAVAHKMGRRWIGIELGDHAYTHCAPRLKAVVDGEQGGISKALDWKGGGGFRFYELAPSLLERDPFGNLIISEAYDAPMLAAAMARHEGYTYAPDSEIHWKQGHNGEKNYIFTTTNHLTAEYLNFIRAEMREDEYLLICAESYDKPCEKQYPNITLRQIPKMLLGRCEFGRENYNLNVVEMPESEDFDDE